MRRSCRYAGDVLFYLSSAVFIYLDVRTLLGSIQPQCWPLSEYFELRSYMLRGEVHHGVDGSRHRVEEVDGWKDPLQELR